MTVIKGNLGAVYIASGSSSTFTTEAMTANAAKTEYKITNEAKRFWDSTATTTVYYNGGAVTDYAEIRYPAGTVTWAVTPGDAAVTVTGKYFAVAQLGEAREWSMEVNHDFIDVSTFGDTYRVNEPMFRNATVTLNHFYVDDELATIATAGSLIGVDLFMDSSTGTEARYAVYGYISSLGITTPVDGVIEEPVTLTVTHGPYYAYPL